jgi:hypothetical protein
VGILLLSETMNVNVLKTTKCGHPALKRKYITLGVFGSLACSLRWAKLDLPTEASQIGSLTQTRKRLETAGNEIGCPRNQTLRFFAWRGKASALPGTKHALYLIE